MVVAVVLVAWLVAVRPAREEWRWALLSWLVSVRRRWARRRGGGVWEQCGGV